MGHVRFPSDSQFWKELRCRPQAIPSQSANRHFPSLLGSSGGWTAGGLAAVPVVGEADGVAGWGVSPSFVVACGAGSVPDGVGDVDAGAGGVADGELDCDGARIGGVVFEVEGGVSRWQPAAPSTKPLQMIVSNAYLIVTSTRASILS